MEILTVKCKVSDVNDRNKKVSYKRIFTETEIRFKK